MKKAYLLCGGPGTGKTTLLKQVLAAIPCSAGGFYTEEIRSAGVRQGFSIVTLEGKSGELAHVNIHSPYRVSKYGVDIQTLEQVAVPAVRQATQTCDVVVIDEIGKMELISPAFRQVVLEALESDRLVLGTIMLSPHPWADQIKQHPTVELMFVSWANRDQLQAQLMQHVSLCK